MKPKVCVVNRSRFFQVALCLISLILFGRPYPVFAQTGIDIELGVKILTIIQQNKKWIPEADYPKIEGKWKHALLSDLVSTSKIENFENGESTGGFFEVFVDNIATWEISTADNAILFRDLFRVILETRGLSYPLHEIMKLAIPFAEMIQSGADLRLVAGLEWTISRLSMIVETAIERSSLATINEILAQPQSGHILLSPHLFLMAYLNGVRRSKIIDYESKHALSQKYLSVKYPGEIQNAALDLAAHEAWKAEQESKNSATDSSPTREAIETVDLLIDYFFGLSDSTENIWLRANTIKGISSIPSPTKKMKDFFLNIAINRKYPTDLRQKAFEALLKTRGYLDPGAAYAGGPPDHLWLRNLRAFLALKYDLFAEKVARSCRSALDSHL